jgi:hypothetical protein
MNDVEVSQYIVDLTNHSNRLRLESAVPGRQMKVVLRHASDPSQPVIHGAGLVSADEKEFSIHIATPAGVHRLSQSWPALSAELAGFAEFD